MLCVLNLYKENNNNKGTNSYNKNLLKRIKKQKMKK